MIQLPFLFFLFAFVGGQIFSVSFGSGVRVSLLDIAVAVFVFVNVIRMNIQPVQVKMWLKSFGPFIAVALLSLILHLFTLPLRDLTISSLYLIRFGLYAAIVLVISGESKANKQRYLIGLWSGGVAIGLLGLMQYFLYPNLRNLAYLGWDPHEFRLFSTLLDPNFAAIILVLTLILSTQMIQHKNTLWRKFVIVASGLCLVALLLTYSRGGYLAFGGALIYWALLNKKIKEMLLVGLFFGSALLILPRPGGEGVNLLRTMSIGSRLKNSQEAIEIFAKSPIIGVGFDTLRFIRGQTEIVVGTGELSHSGAGFHNSFLFILATTGIIGLLSYVWLWKSVLREAYKSGQIELIILSLVAVSVHSLFDNSLFFPAAMLWLWVIAGVNANS